MPAAVIVQLILALGPAALKLIPELAKVWTKDSIPVEEVARICSVAQKSYDEYIAEAKAGLTAAKLTPA